MTTQTKLQAGALGLGESIVMGVAGSAPAYSLSATSATLIASVGIMSSASLLFCGLIMFGVTLSYMNLNRLNPNSGASYAWVGQIFNPTLGFFSGWALLVASAVFMVSATFPAATATLLLVKPELASNTTAVPAVAALWLLMVSAIIIKGIKATSYTQVTMTIIETGVLLAVVIAAIIQFGAQPAHHFSWSWFSPLAFTPELFATGALTALFFFWGWDVTVNLNEETRDSASAPGRGAVLAMVVILGLFITFITITLLVLTDEEIQRSSTNIVFAVADKLFPKPWSYLAIIAVMLSTIGTLETSILQFTRTMYAKSRDGNLHPRYAALHSVWQTPWVATTVIAGLGLVLLFMSSFFTSINQIIKISVDAIGFQVAFYYGLAGFACAWHFRKEARQSLGQFFLRVIWPALSACILWGIALYSIPTFDITTNVVGIGGIAIGVFPLLLNRLRRRGSALTGAA